MGYAWEPLPSYHKLRNCSYSIILSYTTSLSTPQFILPRPGPTIALYDSSLASDLPPFIAHIWVGRPPFPLWLPAVSWCTFLCSVAPRLSLPPLPVGYSHSPPAQHFSGRPMICCSVRWWNPSRTLSMSLVATLILLLYKSTNCTNALYITPLARTVSPVFSIALATIPHCLKYLCRFWYATSQLMLF